MIPLLPLVTAVLVATAPTLTQDAAKKPAPVKTAAAKPKPVAKPAPVKQPAKPAPVKPKPAGTQPKPAPVKPKPATAEPKPADIAPLSHAEKDGFEILQVAAPDAAKFIAGWKMGAGGKSTTTRTVANQPLFTFLLFRGCKPDAEGKCDIIADFVIHRPDGTINDENKGVVVWNKAAPADPKKPYIGDGALGYGVDDEGPFGDYRIVATVTDRVAGISVTTEQTLTIAPGKTMPPADPAKVERAKPDPALPAPAAPDPATPTAPEPADPPAK